jgi:PRC-barrel domain
MIKTFVSVVMTVGLLSNTCHAQGTATQTLLGAPVFAADGVKVGEVTEVSTDEDGKFDLLRMTTGLRLGLGERQVIIPRPAFIIRGKKVTLPDLSAEDVEAFPDAPSDLGNLRREER